VLDDGGSPSSSGDFIWLFLESVLRAFEHLFVH
jgi:hypothetical protein